MLRAELVTHVGRKILYPDVLSIGCKRGGADFVVVYRKDGEIGTDTYNRSDIFRYTTRVAPVEEEVGDGDDGGDL